MDSQSTCPLCGSSITPEKLRHVQAQLAATGQLDIEARIEEVRRQVQAEAARKSESEFVRLRQSTERDHQRALQRQRAELHRDRLVYLKKIQDLERSLQQKTANQLGDAAEIDLFEMLKAEFPSDQITRVRKGKAGADLVHEFVHKSQVCGRVLIESKNSRVWHTAYVRKLRSDQMKAHADHAILCTLTFPVGKRDILVQNGVIVVNPSGIAQVLQLLRCAAIRMQALALSTKQCSDKTRELYAYINSKEFTQTFAEIGDIANGLVGLDVDEQKRHESTWSKRGAMITRMRAAFMAVEAEISEIVEQAKTSERMPIQKAV